ncbi:MAG: AAA family ATPase [Planctomycetota bacterium]|jgi:predicted ATPase|nr:AAA family ATPase [Planctomycetota bacterium]
MKIESIRLKNFKTFQNTTLDNIPNLFVIVGANGTGKSALFQVFGFLKDCLTYNVAAAVQSQGGWGELVSRGHEQESLAVELQFRMEISGVERRVSYFLELDRQDNKVEVAREILRYKRGAHGSPVHFLDFTRGRGQAVVNEDDFNKTGEKLTKEDQDLDAADILAVKGLGQFAKFKAANAFRQFMENWHISDFQINLARGSKDAAGVSTHLSVSGDNLQLVANRLYQEKREIFNKVLELLKNRVPGINSIEPEPTKDGRIGLKFQDSSFVDSFGDKYVSDGTIKMFAYLLLLYDPQPHPLLCVGEPEKQVYPQLLGELAEEFRSYAKRGGQVFVSTHSPDFLDAINLEEVFWLVKIGGYSKVCRAKDDKQIAAFMADGDKMGYLWKHGFFPEVDPQ